MTAKHIIIVGLILFVIGLVVATRLPKRFRFAWIVPAILLTGLVAFLFLRRHEVIKQARQLFGHLETGKSWSSSETEALSAISLASIPVRRQVLELAFASPTNATIALPRMTLLLQSCIGLDFDGDLRRNLWRDVVQPAMKKRPSLEVLRLATATADLLELGSNEVTQVAEHILPILRDQSDHAMRSLLVNELSPLADRMQPVQAEILTESLLRQMGEGVNPAEIEPLMIGLAGVVKRLGPEGARQSISQAISIMQSSTNGSKALNIATGLAALREQMTPEQAARVAERLSAGWLESNGQVKVAIPPLLAELAKGMRSEDLEKLLTEMFSTLPMQSVNVCGRSWASALAPLLTEAAARMDKKRTADILSGLLRKSPHVWTDILWGNLMTPLTAALAPEEIQPLADESVTVILGTKGEAMGWYVTRFSAVASRLNGDQAQGLIDKMFSRLTDPGDGSEFAAAVLYVSLLAERLDPAQANAFADQLLPFMEQADPVRLLSLAGIIGPIASRLEPSKAEAAIRCLVAAMHRGNNIYRVSMLAERLAPFSSRVSDVQMHQLIDQLVVGMEKEHEPEGLANLTSGLAPFADFMDETQGGVAGEGIVRAIEKDPRKFFIRSQAIELVAKRMRPEQSQRAVDVLLKRGLRGGPEIYMALQNAPRVAGALTPEMAESFAMEVTSTLGRERDLPRTCLQMRAAIPFADRMKPEQIRLLGDRLMQTLQPDTNSCALNRLLTSRSRPDSERWSSPRVFIAREEAALETYGLRTLCEALAKILPKMRKEDAAEVAGRLAACFRQQGWVGPLRFDQHFADALQYAPEQALVDILKTPFATGGLRRTALRALELKTGHFFDGRLLAFVSWAKTAPEARNLKLVRPVGMGAARQGRAFAEPDVAEALPRL